MSKIETLTLQTEMLKKTAIEALESLKAQDIAVIDVRDRASFTDLMIFASGTSSRHVNAIAQSVVDGGREAGCKPLGVEGESAGEWVLIDFGDVVVHVMQPETRQFYDLEKLWREEVLAPSAMDSD